MADRLAVIGIGASAGGVEALESLFKAMPPTIGAAIVIVTHLSREHKSLLPEILGRWTAMPIRPAEDGDKLEADHVYTLRANTIVTVNDGRLKVVPRDGESNLIDVFLVSLAESVGEHAIAVILSGTGADGAIGVTAVRGANGFTVAQGTNATRPTYSDMPESAIATGFIDCVAPAEDIPARIAAYLQNASRGEIANSVTGDRESRMAIYTILREQTGHDFSRYKEKTFVRRVERRMQVNEIEKPATYVELLRSDPHEASALFRDLLINVTSFFRDAPSFTALEQVVMPKLFAQDREQVRVWVPGCSTGEEAFSIAMLMLDQRAKLEATSGRHNDLKLQLFATDLDERALAVARAGHYPAALLKEVAPHRLERYFVRHGESYTVTKEVRDICMFSAHSLIRDPPFSNIDLISCRNLLIYLTAELQDKVIPLFHYALRPNGFLFLGSSESVSKHEDRFVPIDKKNRIFQRQDLPSRLAMFPLFARSSRESVARLAWAAVQTPAPAHGNDALKRLEARLVDRYAPPHAVINNSGEVIRYSSRIGPYLEVPAGAPTRNILQVVKRGLRPSLRAALHDAQQNRKNVSCRDVSLDDGSGRRVDILVEPVAGAETSALWTVIITDMDEGNKKKIDEEVHPPVDEDTALAHAERELQQLRERLQTAVEEYATSVEELKSANEELLSVNEELQSANEELETSKEELQSVNEELHAVNHELSAKVDELDRSNTDMKNLFESTQIATVFLDKKMNIRGFTPAASGIFRLIQADIGRPLTDIAAFVDYGNVADDVKNVLAGGPQVERSVGREMDRNHYLMRIFPYHNSENQVDGAIVTMVNVTYMIEAEEHQRLLVAELNHRVKNMLAVLSALASQLARRCSTIEEFTEGFLGRVRGLARTHEMLAAAGWSEVSLKDLLELELTPFLSNRERVTMSGPEIRLLPRTANSLSVVFYELATNAVKYGALGHSDGRLVLEWGFEQIDGRKHMTFRWQEKDGPPVITPRPGGYGSEVIKRLIEYEMGGVVEVRYDESGIIVRIALPTAENLPAKVLT